MKRKTKLEQALERQDPAAPFLFDEIGLPLRNDLVEAIKQERYRHTGASLVADDAKALRMVELLCCGWGIKRIAQAMEVSPHTIRAARTVLVQTGQMAPYKARVGQLFEDIVETGAASYLDDLENGRVLARDKPVGVGIFADKRALLLGEPTSITLSAHAAVDQGSLSVQALNSWVEALPVAQVPTHAPSEHPPQIAQESEASGG
jgi:hypothetical protein